MKEKVISFDTAKLAKEKGFKLQVRSMYLDRVLYLDTNSKGNYNSVKWVRTWRNSPNDDTLSAPTQALLQKWLRDTYGIEFIIVCGGGSEDVEKFYNVTVPSCYIPDKKNGAHFTSDNYEEALELGLQHALTEIQTLNEECSEE